MRISVTDLRGKVGEITERLRQGLATELTYGGFLVGRILPVSQMEAAHDLVRQQNGKPPTGPAAPVTLTPAAARVVPQQGWTPPAAALPVNSPPAPPVRRGRERPPAAALLKPRSPVPVTVQVPYVKPQRDE